MAFAKPYDKERFPTFLTVSTYVAKTRVVPETKQTEKPILQTTTLNQTSFLNYRKYIKNKRNVAQVSPMQQEHEGIPSSSSPQT